MSSKIEKLAEMTQRNKLYMIGRSISVFFIVFLFVLLLPFENISTVYAVDSNTILKIDSLEGFHRVGQEIMIKGTLKTTDDYSVTGETILIKTNSNLNDSGVIASDLTDARGKFVAKTIVEDWGEQVDIYAVFLGTTQYDTAVSNSKPMNIRQAYSYENPNIALSANNDNDSVTQNFVKNNPTMPTPNTHNTQMILSIQRGSEIGFAKVYPSLVYDKNTVLDVNNVQISVDGNYVDLVSSNQWSKEVYVGSGDLISASFLTLTKDNNVYTLSQDTIIIPRAISIPTPISENVENFVRLWDWGAVVLGLVFGIIVKIILEHWAKIKTIKNIFFIIGAMVLIGLFAVSEDNNISENLQIFDPEQLVQTENPNYFVFGILIAYIFGWIKEILRDHGIKMPLTQKINKS